MISANVSSYNELKKQNNNLHIDSALMKVSEFQDIHETHMHYNASGYGVESSWVYLMNCSSSLFEGVISKYKSKKNLSDFEEKLLRLARCIRCKYYCDSVEGLNVNKVVKFLNNEEGINSYCIGEKIFYNCDNNNKKHNCTNDKYCTLKERFNYSMHNPYCTIIDYVILDCIENKEKYDYIKVDDNNKMNHILSERIFHRNVQKSKNKHNDYYIGYMLYLCAYSMYIKKEIQQIEHLGFEQFKKFEGTKNIISNQIQNNSPYSINNNFKKCIDNGLILSTISKYVEDNCYNIEFRKSIYEKYDFNDFIKTCQLFENNDYLHDYCRNNNFDKKDFNFKFIFHFSKTKPGNHQNYNTEHKEQRNKYTKQFNKILKFIEDNPLSPHINNIIAIDTCNQETYVPPWVFSPIYLKRKHIRSTYHVGEDFHNLVHGIRDVEFTIDFLDFNKGDRLGHASAILIDHEKYYMKKNNKIFSNRIDNLDDMAVLYNALKNNNYEDSTYIRRISEKFNSLINELRLDISEKFSEYFKNINISDWYSSMILRNFDHEILETNKITLKKNLDYKSIYDSHKRYKEQIEKEIKNKFRTDVNIKITEALKSIDAYILYNIYMYEDIIYKINKNVVSFDANEKYIHAVGFFQDIVKNKIIDNDYVVEVNLTSNYLINDYDKYEEHGLFRVRKFKFNDVDRNILITLGTDDSAIFGTTIFRELEIIYTVLREKGYGAEEALNEVKDIVRLSNQLSFINN